ncbi:MAG: DUF2461 family protein [Terriglobia bacterium]
MDQAESFLGFTRDSFAFFAELAAHNNTAWFKENRERYDRHVAGNFRGLLAALEPFLLKLNPNFETAGKTNRNFSRINRDIRFSKDKSPYKSNYYLYVFDSRHDRGHAGRLYVGLSADCLTVGFSIYGGAAARRGREKAEPADALAAIFRKRVVANCKIFERLLQGVVRKGRYETYWHREEKKDWAQHSGLPRRDEDWQTLQAWVVRRVFLPESRAIQTPAFARQIERVFEDLYPLYVFTSVDARGWQREVTKRRA